jgi:carbamoyl-phosphate synthase large subunit
LAARVMIGDTLDEIGFTEEIIPPYVSVKEAVFPFNKFPGTDPVLGPEMRSTGECMGIADSFGAAFAKAQLAASNGLPLQGVVLITVTDGDKPTVTPIARRFHEMGFEIMATAGTAQYLRARGIPAKRVFKVHEGRPNALDLLVNGEVQLLINTPLGKLTQQDDYIIRQAALQHRTPYTTTMSAASAACDAIVAVRSRVGEVRSLQEWHALARNEMAESRA